MNKENIQSFIKYLEKSTTFSMHEERWDGRNDEFFSFGRTYLEGCGAPACIVGHFNHWKKEEYGDKRGFVSRKYFENFLGITEKQGREIFKPQSYYAHAGVFPHYQGYITKEHAIGMLKNLLRTGEVDWNPNRCRWEEESSKEKANRISKDIIQSYRKDSRSESLENF